MNQLFNAYLLMYLFLCIMFCQCIYLDVFHVCSTTGMTDDSVIHKL